jgi:hypothetical protein
MDRRCRFLRALLTIKRDSRQSYHPRAPAGCLGPNQVGLSRPPVHIDHCDDLFIVNPSSLRYRESPEGAGRRENGVAVYIERLEMMLRAAWPQAIQGNLKAVMVVLRVLKQEAKFYGLDNGAQDEVELGDGVNLLEQYRQRR